MTRKAVKALNNNWLDGAHRFVVFVAAIGFLFQSYVTQTHIHFGSRDIGAISETTGHAPAKGPLDKAADCPLCQAVVHAGVFVMPSAPLVYLSFDWIQTARLVFAAPVASSDVAHDWRSRAPPRG